MKKERIPVTVYLDELEWILDYASDDPNFGQVMHLEKILKGIRERNKLPPTVLQS